MNKQLKIRKGSAGMLVLFILFSLLTGKVNAQEEIDEELYNKDSLIQMVGKQNIDTSYTWEWNQDSSRWDFHGRNIEFYKGPQNLLASHEQRWQPEDKEFANHKRSIKSYNDKNKVVEDLEQEWDSTSNDWVNLELRTITYDRLGNRSEILYQEWKRALGKWVNTTRYLIEYNRMGEKSNIVIRAYDPEEDRWYNHQRYLFEYEDGFGPPDASIVEGWNRAKQDWEEKGRYNMEYNFRGQKTMESRATWNQSIKDYINGIRYLIDYDKKKKTSETLQHWDLSSDKWNNRKQWEFKYDEDGELKEELTYQWDKKNQQWSLQRRLRYSMEPDPEQLKAEIEESQQEEQ
ncbi:MAG: hypothetical protein ACLFM7_05785 [Bacteroidales bacterium]